MAHILLGLSIVDSLFGQNNHQGKEKERTNHGKNCKEEGFSPPPPNEGQEGLQAFRQRPSQAGEARGSEIFGPTPGQGRLNRGKRRGAGVCPTFERPQDPGADCTRSPTLAHRS